MNNSSDKEKSPPIIRSSSQAIAANAIVIVLDSLRADHVGCYGNDWIKTPAMDALADESIVFTRAFPESLPTIPMRLALHTGVRAWPFRQWEKKKGVSIIWAGWQPIPEERETLAEALTKADFQTGFISDTYHYFSPTMNFHRGFRQFLWIRGQEADPYRSTLSLKGDEVKPVFDPPVPEDIEGLAFYQALNVASYLANQGERKKEEDYPAPRVFQEAMTWLDENRNAERFFLLIDAFDPHEPWDPPKKYVDAYDSGYKGREMVSPVYGPCDYLSEAELKHMRARYAAEVTFVDKWLGRFLDYARKLGVLENTLLVLASDHGHQLGEHGLTGKMPQGLWYELVDVPLIIRSPDGTGAGTRVDAFAQHHDIVPTVLASLDATLDAPLKGVDLLQLARNKIRPREHVSCGLHDYSWCRDKRYTFMMRNDGANPQLFDMDADPKQESNLASEEAGVVAEMRAKLLADSDGPLPLV
jgi:arylsulfatase A-like enzyme